jgi:hypothetical protein
MKIQKESSTRKPQERTKDYLEIFPKVIRCNGSHTSYNGDDPVSLTKDGPKMKAWEEMRAPDNEHNIIIRSSRARYVSSRTS